MKINEIIAEGAFMSGVGSGLLGAVSGVGNIGVAAGFNSGRVAGKTANLAKGVTQEWYSASGNMPADAKKDPTKYTYYLRQWLGKFFATPGIADNIPKLTAIDNKNIQTFVRLASMAYTMPVADLPSLLGDEPEIKQNPKVNNKPAAKLPDGVIVLQRDPIIIQFKKQEYTIDGELGWVTFDGKQVPAALADILDSWKGRIDNVNITPPQQVNTNFGIATRQADGSWTTNSNGKNINPKSFAALDTAYKEQNNQGR